MNEEEKEKITDMLDNVWDDYENVYSIACSMLDEVKSLEYRLEDIKEVWRNNKEHLSRLYKHFGIKEEGT